ncbi:hypothetical protein ACF3N8_00565 [Staphylococcus massiliensis]|uniref:hypothetical protein n=1 Tax=Staphylococcus massiliensis TaxID=555791 RepID=UPI001EE0F89C|nr:hypothetical protein [Staphylococcus massiliensis]MCG3413113.1 hypothetical protein [Staphylococcus massiliensis]
MSQHNQKQLKTFQRNFILFPYIIFALLLLIVFFAIPQLTLMLLLLGGFTIYHVVLLFISFIVLNYKKTSVMLLFYTLAITLFFAVYLITYLLPRL